MSVPKSQRSPSSMQYIETGKAIYKECMKFAASLPNRYAVYIGKSIYEAARGGYMNCRFANSTNPQNRHEAQIRRDYLNRANCQYDYLLGELDNARSIKSSDSKQVVLIVDLVVREQKLISGVKSADAKRYSSLPE